MRRAQRTMQREQVPPRGRVVERCRRRGRKINRDPPSISPERQEKCANHNVWPPPNVGQVRFARDTGLAPLCSGGDKRPLFFSHHKVNRDVLSRGSGT